MSLLLLPFSHVALQLPGSGKRKDFQTYIPRPAYEAKPNKPFRPVWDKPKGGEVEQHPKPKPRPQGPPPLPPASLFTQPQPLTDALPDFSQYAVADPNGLAQRMQQARDLRDLADAVRVLQQLFAKGQQ
jgi:hypothetical protein